MTGSVADELKKLVELRDQGVLTPEEFESAKEDLIAGTARFRPSRDRPPRDRSPGGSPTPTPARPTAPPASSAPQGGSSRQGLKAFLFLFALFGVLIIFIILGARANKNTGGGSESSGGSASYAAKIEGINPISSSRVIVGIYVQNIGSGTGTPSCVIQLLSPDASDDGTDGITAKSPIPAGGSGSFQDTITVTNNGAANVTVGASNVSCS